MVPFQNRDELTVLLDWCRQTTAGDSTGLAVVTGIGGSGKTRLALELANRLRREGWYAGTFPKGVAGAGWLAGVVSPVLVVLDYADGRVTDATALLAALRTRRESPAVVLLTARAVDGDWLANIVEALDSDAHPYRTEPVALPDTHPDSVDVYHRTVAALTTEAVQPPPPPRGIRWTTLDFVLLGWVFSANTTPRSPARSRLSSSPVPTTTPPVSIWRSSTSPAPCPSNRSTPSSPLRARPRRPRSTPSMPVTFHGLGSSSPLLPTSRADP